MNKRLRSMIAGAAVLLSGLAMCGQTAAASAATCVTLQPSRTYKYNLDMTGAKETIQCIVTEHEPDDEYGTKTGTYTVKINGKLVYRKNYSDYENPFQTMVVDTDKKDNSMELLILEKAHGQSDYAGWSWTSDYKQIRYYTYANGKAVFRQDLAKLFKKQFKNLVRIHAVSDAQPLTIAGDGYLGLRICLMPKYNYVTYYHVKAELQLKKGKFQDTPLREYRAVDEEKGGPQYRFAKKTKVYADIKGKKAAFTAAKDSWFSVRKICRDNKGKCYLLLQMAADKKKVGYVDLDKLNLVNMGTKHVG